MRKIVTLVGAIAIAGCSGAVGGVGSTSSGGGGVMGRGVVQSAGGAVTNMGPRSPQSDVVADSIAFARTQLGGQGFMTAHDDFAALKSVVGVDGLNHVRLQQTRDGVPVWGSDIVVHSNDQAFLGIGGNILTLSGLDLKPSFSAQSALAAAKGDYARAATTADPLAYDREKMELVVLPIDGGNAVLAWHVSFYTDLQAGVKPGLWNYFVDAHTGAIVDRQNWLDTAVEASGPGGNARVSRTWTNDLDVVQSGSSYVMNTTQVETTNLNHGTSGTGTPYSGTSLNPLTTDKGANDAHGFAEITLKMLSDWFGYNSIDNKGYKIVSRVHYSSNYDNAFWDGTQMSYGDGDGTTFYQFTGALDVIAHEIDHGFTSNHSNLTYSGQSGGMNESFSDIAGTAAKFYYDANSADFYLGADIYVKAGQWIRYMCTPSKDGHSIDNASQYNSGLDVHYTSGVMNRAFCRAAKRLSGVDPNSDTAKATADGVKKAAKAWYVANANYWTSSTNWTQGCQGVVDAATSLGYAAADIAALGDSWKDVGVTCNYSGGGGGGGGCTPQCSGKMCGDDGCGGSCGSCQAGQTCSAAGQCTGGGGGGGCAHDLCTTGTKLTSSCDPCATKICAQDSYCCTTAWDNICVGEVSSICGQSCGGGGGGGGGGGCAHDKCTTGTKLSKTCDSCVTSICTQDSYCCNNKWDSICVGEVGSICGQSCN